MRRAPQGREQNSFQSEPPYVGCYKGVVGGPGRAGEFAELRRQKFDGVATGLPFHLVKEFAQRFEQRLTRARDAAADNGRFAIENIDEGTNGRGERFDRSQPDFRSRGIAGMVRRDEIMRGFESAARALLDRVIADGDFERAGSPGAIGRTVRIERDVSQVTRAANMPAE